MRRRAAVQVGAAALLPGFAGSGAALGQVAADGTEGVTSLDAMLRPFLASHGLPALAAAAVRAGRIVAAGAVGTRRAGADIPVTLDDRFHIGSDTKAMTSLLAGMMVEEGRLRWDATVGASFPDLAAGMDPGLRSVTLEQLLSHTGGVPPDDEAFVRLLVRSYEADEGNLDAARLWLLREWGARPLAHAPGTRFAYSNLGYLIAGAMIERAAGRTWEELICARVFDPLGLHSAGLGPQASRGRTDAPLGHVLRPDGSAGPMLSGPNGDVPAVLGPAGVAHLSILDFATWAGWHAGGGRRGPALVRPETLSKLHTPVIRMPARADGAVGTPRDAGGYALGWGSLTFPWSPEPALTHTGSNTMNLAMIIVRPDRDTGLVLATNIAGERANAALMSVAERLDGAASTTGAR